MTEDCYFCGGPAQQKHHVTPRSEGGVKEETVPCCDVCGKQIHMLFDNKILAKMSLEELKSSDQMKRYLKWRAKHLGPQRARMSRGVKQWKKHHR